MIALAKWSLQSLKFSVSTLGSRRGSIRRINAIRGWSNAFV